MHVVCKIVFPKGVKGKNKRHVPVPGIGNAKPAHCKFRVNVNNIRAKFVHFCLYDIPLVKTDCAVLLGKNNFVCRQTQY